MKKRTMMSLTLAALLGFAGCLAAQDEEPAEKADQPAEKPAPAKVSQEEQIERASYAIGFNTGSNMLQSLKQELGANGIDVNIEKVVEGFLAGINEKDAKLTDQQMQSAMMALQQMMMKAHQDKMANKDKTNKEFLAKVSKQEGVKTTESGLRYKVLEEGKADGLQPGDTDTVTVHYTGKTTDDKVFDSSVERDQPATFQLNEVIRGWTEGVGLMTEGAKYRFWIPADLAYGQRGRPPVIEPNSVLIFDVELINVKRAKPVLPMPEGK